MAVTVSDVTNFELVLMREGNEGDPRSGYEIARGDELTCWHQLELSLRDGRTDAALPRISSRSAFPVGSSAGGRSDVGQLHREVRRGTAGLIR